MEAVVRVRCGMCKPESGVHGTEMIDWFIPFQLTVGYNIRCCSISATFIFDARNFHCRRI